MSRQVQGLTIGCIAVFIYLFSVVFVDYIDSVQSCKYIDWDVKTITASDYSVEFNISQSFYQNFLN